MTYPKTLARVQGEVTGEVVNMDSLHLIIISRHAKDGMRNRRFAQTTEGTKPRSMRAA